jgi:pimeloyl-ACP methyl ester carboxylesterase
MITSTTHQTPKPSRRPGWSRRIAVVTTVIALAAAALLSASTAATSAGTHASSASPAAATVPAAVAGVSRSSRGPKPTIVLVHGAFADASGWSSVSRALTRAGYDVYAPPNPLRGLHQDAEYLRYFLDTIDGPVILVGHSYGGAVITNAATGNAQVKGLVYIAAYALDEGETVEAANALGGHPEESLLLANARTRPYPDAPTHEGQTDVDVYIAKDAFRKVFAADVPKAEAAFMAASQRPGSLFSLGTPSGEPAWKTIPSYYLVANHDKAVPPSAERAMAARAGATTWHVNSSHVPMVSRPHVVSKLVTCAARGGC